MNDERLQTIEQVRGFLEGSEVVGSRASRPKRNTAG